MAHLPPFFRSLGLLRGLNVIGVGCALASLTGVVFANLLVSDAFSEQAALGTALPTLFVGLVWALLLRWRRRVGRKQRRLGWLLSLPLAIVNMQVAMLIVFLHHDAPWRQLLDAFWPTTLACVTVGVIIWGPALVLTLGAFGVPLAWSQKQAEKGLAGEERGEVAVGLTVALLAVLALALGASRYPSEYRTPKLFDYPGELRDPAAIVKSLRAPDSPATRTLAALAGLGAACGGTAALLALSRERRRRRFVARAEEGNEKGYTVRETPEGKVLVRVALDQPTYRALDEEESLFALDPAGLATHPARELPPPSRP